MTNTVRIAERDLSIDKVLYAESYGNYVKIYCDEENILLRITLSAILGILEPHGFCQCHRRFILNNGRISSIADRFITLENKMKVPVSRTYHHNFEV